MAAKGILNLIRRTKKHDDNSTLSSCCGSLDIVPDDDLPDEGATTNVGATASSGETTADRAPADIVVITGSCCSPAAKPFDERALRVVNVVLAETGTAANLRIISATAGMNGALPSDVLEDLQHRQVREGLRLPVLMIDGVVIAGGRIDPEHVHAGLAHAGSVSGTG